MSKSQLKDKVTVGVMFLILFSGCKNASQSASVVEIEKGIVVTNEFIGCAEGGDYEIIDRHPCVEEDDSIVVCPVTVKDDLKEKDEFFL